MATGQFKLKIHEGKMRAVVGGVSAEAVERAAKVSERRYVQNILKNGLVDTGRLQRRTTYRPIPVSNAMFPKYRIGTPMPYAGFLERGTRAHGPKRSKFMRFVPKGGARPVFTTWVRGVRAYGFAKTTLDQIRPKDFSG